MVEYSYKASARHVLEISCRRLSGEYRSILVPKTERNLHSIKIVIREASGNQIVYKDGIEFLKICLNAAPAADVLANFSDAMDLPHENVTPVRTLDAHFPYVILKGLSPFYPRGDYLEVMNDLHHSIVRYVENGGEYQTSIRIFFEDFGVSTHRIVIATIIHEILQDYSVDLRAIYRGESIGDTEAMEILNLH